MDKQINTVAAKKILRDEIKADIEKWLSLGNKIEVLESGSNYPSKAVGIE